MHVPALNLIRLPSSSQIVPQRDALPDPQPPPSDAMAPPQIARDETTPPHSTFEACILISTCPSGGIGRRAWLRAMWPLQAVEVRVLSRALSLPPLGRRRDQEGRFSLPPFRQGPVCRRLSARGGSSPLSDRLSSPRRFFRREGDGYRRWTARRGFGDFRAGESDVLPRDRRPETAPVFRRTQTDVPSFRRHSRESSVSRAAGRDGVPRVARA